MLGKFCPEFACSWFLTFLLSASLMSCDVFRFNIFPTPDGCSSVPHPTPDVCLQPTVYYNDIHQPPPPPKLDETGDNSRQCGACTPAQMYGSNLPRMSCLDEFTCWYYTTMLTLLVSIVVQYQVSEKNFISSRDGPIKSTEARQG